VSSAYLKMRFPAVTGCRSATVTKYDTGPSPELWVTLAFTSVVKTYALFMKFRVNGGNRCSSIMSNAAFNFVIKIFPTRHDRL